MSMPDELFRQEVNRYLTSTGENVTAFHKIITELVERVDQGRAENKLRDDEITDLKERLEKLEKKQADEDAAREARAMGEG